ncbi:hypothetical protein FOXYSP1_08610 [Fusarium oxysporum f. sp. phaseoli]
MRVSAIIAVALGWITSASAFGVPDVLQKIEQKLPTREAPPPKYFSECTLLGPYAQWNWSSYPKREGLSLTNETCRGSIVSYLPTANTTPHGKLRLAQTISPL